MRRVVVQVGVVVAVAACGAIGLTGSTGLVISAVLCVLVGLVAALGRARDAAASALIASAALWLIGGDSTVAIVVVAATLLGVLTSEPIYQRMQRRAMSDDDFARDVEQMLRDGRADQARRWLRILPGIREGSSVFDPQFLVLHGMAFDFPDEVERGGHLAAPPRTKLRAAAWLHERGDFQAAENIARSVTIDPDDPDAALHHDVANGIRGTSAMYLGALDRAEPDLNEAFQRRPSEAHNAGAWAELLLRTDRRTEAIEVLEWARAELQLDSALAEAEAVLIDLDDGVLEPTFPGYVPRWLASKRVANAGS